MLCLCAESFKSENGTVTGTEQRPSRTVKAETVKLVRLFAMCPCHGRDSVCAPEQCPSSTDNSMIMHQETGLLVYQGSAPGERLRHINGAVTVWNGTASVPKPIRTERKTKVSEGGADKEANLSDACDQRRAPPE